MISELDPKKVSVALDWIKKLANGINPIDGSVLSDNDIVNNVHISRCLYFVAEILEKTAQKKISTAKQYEKEFYLSPEDMSRVSITEKSSISVLVKDINSIIPSNMKPLSYSTVTNWLIKHGYLDVIVTEDGRKTKVPTDLGKSLGISTEQRFGSNGEYTAVIYNANAQRFILDNLLQV